MSNYLESGILNHIFRTNSFTKPVNIAVALCSTPIADENAIGSAINEVANAGSYARQLLNPSDANWIFGGQVNGSGVIYNNTTISFPEATVAWGHISGIAILDSATYGGGALLFRGTPSVVKFIDVTDQLTIRPSGITVYLN
jgi:hypothetical protein